MSLLPQYYIITTITPNTEISLKRTLLVLVNTYRRVLQTSEVCLYFFEYTVLNTFKIYEYIFSIFILHLNTFERKKTYLRFILVIH